jgi:hypothetical protein
VVSEPAGIGTGRVARVDALAVGATLALAAALRLPAVGWGFTGDETALLADRPLDVLLDAETAINPPLLPLLLQLAPVDARLATFRVVAVVASILATGVAWWALRGLARDRWIALVGGLAVATDPRLLLHGVEVRSYAFWIPLAWLHLGALVRLLDGDARPTVRRAWLVSTVLLPWVHYTSFAVLAVEAIGLARARRDLLRSAAWAPLAWAPLLVAVVVHHHPTDHATPLAETARILGTMGYPAGLGTVVAALAWVGLPLALLGWERLRAAERATVLGVLASLGAAVVAAGWQHFRWTMVVFVLVPLLALTTTTAGAPARWRRPLALAVGSALAVGHLLVLDPLTLLATDPRSLPAVAAAWPELDLLRAGRPLLVPSPEQVARLYHQRTGHHLFLDRGDAPNGCAHWSDCAVIDGVEVRALGAGDDVGLLVEERAFRPFLPPPGCAVRERRAGFTLWDCR